MRNIALAVILGLSLCFAQEANPIVICNGIPMPAPCIAQESAPEKLAVYASGASDAGVNRLLGSKLLSAMSQSGAYAEIADPAVFQDEVARSGKGDIASIAQAAKRHGADYVCVVSMTEVFGAHSITARLIKAADAQVVKTGSADRAIKSLEDLTAVSNELARQLLPPSATSVPPAVFATPSAVFAVPPQDAAPPPAEAVPPPVVAQKQCDKKYNINELLFKVKDGFPTQLKDCSSKLVKDMMTPASFGGKKLEPKSFMMQCPVDGIKKELPEGFPNVDKILGSVTNFVQGILGTALAGGALDPKKLPGAVASMNIMELLNDLKKAASDECIVDEPYEPPVQPAGEAKESDSGEEKKEGGTSFGIRIGLNYSHTYAETPYKNGDYGDIGGMQAGFVVDFAPSSWFHIQPGLMYMQKGMWDKWDNSRVTTHYLELPLLLSLKLAAFRLNAGPYFSLCVGNSSIFKDDIDIGLSTGVGFDIGMFYIGTFYDHGFTDVSNVSGYSFYNRTLGFNLGINL